MPNVWVLMYNVEVMVDNDEHEVTTVTTSKPIRVYQQHATAMAMMDKYNLSAKEQAANDNFVYYSIEEVSYV